MQIYSTWRSFAALKADGSITAWGYTDAGGTDAPNAPTDKGYIKIYSNGAFVCLYSLPHELSKLPHDVIEPSALRAAKALSLE
jgi:hypothetical protein